MKKYIIVISIIIIILCLNTSNKIVIPKDSIRFRVIAESNSKEDQQLKKEIVNNLKEEISKIEFNSQSVETSREQIKSSIPKFNEIVDETISSYNRDVDYSINYGMNYFPKKEYKGVIYQEGDYESLVITLGEGAGNNFWCVLFPPLCLVDEDNKTDIEYTSIIKEILDKYF